MNRFVINANWLVLGICVLGVITCAVAGNPAGAIWATSCLIQTAHNQMMLFAMEKK